MSNMEIKKGMYVRTKNGRIDKVIGILNHRDIIDGRTIQTGNEEKDFFYGVEDWTDIFLPSHFIKASYDIVDLIEAGDYVNESRVMKINKETGTIFLELGHITKEYYDKIYSIVTKEQFEKISYKVGD